MSTDALLDQIHHADLFDLCDSLPDASIDMILADLPYGTTACSWDTVIPFEPLWTAFKRVIKPRGAIVLTASQPFTSALVMSNPTWFKYSWVWVKTRPSDHINAKNKPMPKHEDVLTFSLGTTANCSENKMHYYPQELRQVNQRSYRPHRHERLSNILGSRPSHINEWTQEFDNYPNSVLEYPNPNNDAVHTSQKPVALFEYLIRTYTREGDVVLDPVVGSGTTARAARACKRHWICGDSSAEYVAIARDTMRLPFEPRQVPQNDDVSDLPLFAQGQA